MNSKKDSARNIDSLDVKMAIEMVEKYFGFLIEEYQFAYDGRFVFTSPKVRIEMGIGHKTPRIYIHRVGEPDFTNMILEVVILYFEGKLPKINFEVHPLEHNIKFMAKVLRDRARKIMNDIDEWWIPVQLYHYKKAEKKYKDRHQLEGFLSSYKRNHDYLKSKGAIE